MLVNLTHSQRALAEYMSSLSERAYDAVWMNGLEHELWTAVSTGPREYGRLFIWACEIAEPSKPSAACAGWIAFDEESEEARIPLSDWERRYGARQVPR